VASGFNIKSKVWRISFPSDDSIGGAQSSGTVAYKDIDLRLHAIEPDQVFLQQGLETLKTFRATVRNHNLLIYERDELEITWPTNHRYYGDRFRVDGVTESNFHPRDRRGYLILNLSRSERAHASQ